MQPLYDRVLIKREEAEETTAGGIIIPEVAKEKPGRGKVVAVGKGRILKDGKTREPIVKPGDLVLFEQFRLTTIREREGLIIVREDDIMGIIE